MIFQFFHHGANYFALLTKNTYFLLHDVSLVDNKILEEPKVCMCLSNSSINSNVGDKMWLKL